MNATTTEAIQPETEPPQAADLFAKFDPLVKERDA